VRHTGSTSRSSTSRCVDPGASWIVRSAVPAPPSAIVGEGPLRFASARSATRRSAPSPLTHGGATTTPLLGKACGRQAIPLPLATGKNSCRGPARIVDADQARTAAVALAVQAAAAPCVTWTRACAQRPLQDDASAGDPHAVRGPDLNACWETTGTRRSAALGSFARFHTGCEQCMPHQKDRQCHADQTRPSSTTIAKPTRGKGERHGRYEEAEIGSEMRCSPPSFPVGIDIGHGVQNAEHKGN
jgi:hypothetical protein